MGSEERIRRPEVRGELGRPDGYRSAETLYSVGMVHSCEERREIRQPPQTTAISILLVGIPSYLTRSGHMSGHIIGVQDWFSFREADHFNAITTSITRPLRSWASTATT